MQWAHSTPTMLLLLSMMAELQPRQVAAMLGWDCLMIWAGLVAAWASGPLQRELGNAGACVLEWRAATRR